MLKVAHILVLDTSVDFDFTHELLLCAALGQRRLLDNLGSMNEVGLSIDEFEALRKATFAQKFSFEVPPDSKFAVLLLELLLDDGLLLAGWLAREGLT